MSTATRLIEVEQQGDTLVLRPQGDLRELDYTEFGDEPEELLLLVSDPAVRHLVLELGAADDFGPTAQELLSRLARKVRDRAGQIEFVNG